VEDFPKPLSDIPDHYSNTRLPTDSETLLDIPWWHAYNDEVLNSLMTASLTSNFSLKAVWNKLEQSEAINRAANADLLPFFDARGETSAEKGKTTDGDPEVSYTAKATRIGAQLSYEVDLWKRNASFVNAQESETEGSRADYESAALLLTGRVAELWIRAQEQKSLLKLLQKQGTLGYTLLKLTKSRFKVGRGSALEVFQQEQQLNSTLSELPVATSAFQQTLNQLAVLIGLPPASVSRKKIAGRIPELPPFPNLIPPVALLDSRPDLRAFRARLKGAQFQIASAVANRLPRLNIELSYDFRAASVADLFTGFAARILGGMVLPVFDGGKQKAEVALLQSTTDEIHNLFSHSFLVALEDVENAITAEQFQKQLIDRLHEEMRTAEAALKQSKGRYIHGLSSYLEVVLAVQSLQTLERRLLAEQREILLARNKLYLALGGSWTQMLPLKVEGA